MAPKQKLKQHAPPTEDPPTASSSGEEEASPQASTQLSAQDFFSSEGEEPSAKPSSEESDSDSGPKPASQAQAQAFSRPKFNGVRPKILYPKKQGTSRNVAVPEANGLLDSEKSDIVDVNLLYHQISGVEGLDEDEMKQGLTLIEESKKRDLERRWKKLRRAEIELVGTRSLLTGEQIMLIHEALQSSRK